MNTLQIILKEFKQQIRDWQTNGIMMLFPILLIAVLGAALSNAFSGNLDFSQVKILYTVSQSAASQPVAKAFEAFSRQVSRSGFPVEQAESVQDGISGVESGSYACYISISPDNIELYENKRYTVESGIVRLMLQAFVLRFNTTEAIVVRGGPIPSASQSGSMGASSVNSQSLSAKRSPGSMDYYAVTMLTLIIMYGALVGMGGMRMELTLKTSNRILCAPLHRWEFLAGKVLGSLLTIAVQMTIVIAFSHFLLGAYWGHDFGTIALVVLSESIMAVSIGVALAFLLPSGGAASAVLNAVIPLFVFFGGGYIPINTMGPAVQTISAFSPLKWVNQALFGVIYDGDYSAVGTAVFATCSLAALFIGLAALRSRKEIA